MPFLMALYREGHWRKRFVRVSLACYVFLKFGGLPVTDGAFPNASPRRRLQGKAARWRDHAAKALQQQLPTVMPSAKGGRLRVGNRAAPNGLLFALQIGVSWEDLPKELGFGSGMMRWRRLCDWLADGVWERLHRVPLKRLRDRLGSGQSASGSEQRGPNPTDRPPCCSADKGLRLRALPIASAAASIPRRPTLHYFQLAAITPSSASR